uniref:carboxy-terminal domain RNA polymerase II polypeptide A small phosphatase 2-like n=1 Tax=Arvicanthis niloticus TaxID=61156 RepID=UPI001485E725|nr:carboxy-terminal domain RNA polymerase II polypeptide A small phosphatase 2-like [Arvicanthis niloticus]
MVIPLQALEQKEEHDQGKAPQPSPPAFLQARPPSQPARPAGLLDGTGSIITQPLREDALVLTKKGLVSKSLPKKPHGRSIFKALWYCFHTQHVDQSSSSTEFTHEEEANTIAKSDLLRCLQYQFYQIPGTCQLPEVTEQTQGRICVVIDLDETLVHSSFKRTNNADFIVPVEIEGTKQQVYMLKKPYVDEFLSQRVDELFDCVLFTASLAKYADPVTDLLDQCGVFQALLFWRSCVFHQGCYVKDLSHLGRDLRTTVILDNSPASYIFHPGNTVPVQSWFDDMADTELLNLIPVFEELSGADDVYTSLGQLRAP